MSEKDSAYQVLANAYRDAVDQVKGAETKVAIINKQIPLLRDRQRQLERALERLGHQVDQAYEDGFPK